MPLNSRANSDLADLETTIVAGRLVHEEKLALQAAGRLERELLRPGWRPGDILGSLSDIRERYSLGRWACREAVGILEMRGVAAFRRGRGGGLVVVEPTRHRLASLILLHLRMKRTSTDEIIEARRAIHFAILRKLLASGARLAPLPAQVRTSLAFSQWCAKQTGNGAFLLLIDILDAVYDRAALQDRSADEGLEPLLTDVWDAVRGGAREPAEQLLSAFLNRTERLEAGGPVAALPADWGCASGKWAWRLAMQLVDEIFERDCGEEANLGSEIDISIRHDCASETVRQAVRLLEALGLASPRAGYNGGVLVCEPNISAVARLVPHLLQQSRLSWAECFELITMLKVEMHRIAALRMRHGRLAPHAVRAAERLIGVVPRQVHDLILTERVLSDLSGNSILISAELGLTLYAPSPIGARGLEDLDALGALAHLYTRNTMQAVLDGDPDRAETLTLEKFALVQAAAPA